MKPKEINGELPLELLFVSRRSGDTNLEEKRLKGTDRARLTKTPGTDKPETLLGKGNYCQNIEAQPSE